MAEVIRLKQWFLRNHIKVPDEWVVACIGWIRAEEGNAQLTQELLHQLVWEQWLVSDLCDLECPCLPQGLIATERVQLTGSYALQVQSLWDISKPAYSQLTKLRGTENENVNVTANTQREPEQKANRVLLLNLTDGISSVQAMEYRPIPVLNPNLSPGSKVILTGPMELRVGVLLITSDNIKVLGGDVESLKDTNNQEHILEKALVPDDPAQVNFRPNWNIPVYQPRFAQQEEHPNTQQGLNYNQQRHITGGPNYNQGQGMDGPNYSQRQNTSGQFNQQQRAVPLTNTYNQNNSFPDDDFPEDDEIDFASLETVDYQVPPQTTAQRGNYHPQVPQQSNPYRGNYQPPQTNPPTWGNVAGMSYNPRPSNYNQGYQNQNMAMNDNQNNSFQPADFPESEFDFASIETVNYQQQMSQQSNRIPQQNNWMQSPIGQETNRMPHQMGQQTNRMPHQMDQSANRMPHQMGQQTNRMPHQMGMGYNQHPQTSNNQENSFPDDNFPDDELFGNEALWEGFDEQQ